MPKFESPLGSKSFSGPAMREYDVPDESVEQLEQESVNPVFRKRQAMAAAAAEEQAYRAYMESKQAQIESFQSPEQDQFAVEREIREAKEARRTGKIRLSEGARKRLEMLIGMTRHTHEAVINGNNYAFQTLKDKEMREAIQKASEYDGTVQQPFEIRKQLLARSITVLAGVDFAQFVGSTSLDVKLDALEELDNALLVRLFSEYLTMVKEATDKYAVKNEEDARQVVEDLKK
jgi:hypothetical protein